MNDIRTLRRMLLYAIMLSGPLLVAMAQFALTAVILYAADSDTFGSFSLLMLAVQLLGGLWAALFCAPFPVLVHTANRSEISTIIRCFFSANILVGVISSVFLFVLALLLGIELAAACLFGCYNFLYLLRLFGRAYAFATSSPSKAWVSDMLFAITLGLIVGVVWQINDGHLTLVSVSGCSSAATLFGILAFGPSYLKRQFVELSIKSLSSYREVWPYSSWSVLGVITTEITANAHAYLITILAGASAFAPLAASSLLIRPVTVMMNALTDYERPRLAGLLMGGGPKAIADTLRHFKAILICAWLLSTGMATIFFAYLPHLVPSRYSIAELVLGAVIWMSIAGVRIARTPESALLQASGLFKWLAYASVSSSFVSVAAAILGFWVGGASGSLAGILIGELVFAYGIIWRARELLGTIRAKGASESP